MDEVHSLRGDPPGIRLLSIFGFLLASSRGGEAGEVDGVAIA